MQTENSVISVLGESGFQYLGGRVIPSSRATAKV